VPTVSGVIYDSAASPVAGRTVRAYRRDTGALLGSATSSDGNDIPGDASYNSTELLIRCAGANDSTSFTSEAYVARAISNPSSNVKVKTGTTPIVGTNSAYFNNSTSTYLTVGAAADYDWFSAMNESWTLDGWLYVTSVAAVTKAILTKGTNNSTMAAPLIYAHGTGVYCGVYKSSGYGSGGDASKTGVLAVSTWSHFMVTYDNATRTLKVAVGGAFGSGGTVVASSNFSTANGQLLTVGRFSDAFFPMDGNLAQLRLTRGVVRETADFTPPTIAAYANAYVPATPLGSYSIDTAGHTGELNVVALDDVAGSTENDRIIRTTGV
jgi:hypothetical protein